MKMKILFTILILLLSFGIFTYAKADSGWDTSYDSGSSWSSDSSWSSGSSWSSSYDNDHDYGSHTSYSGSQSNPVVVIITFFMLVVFILVFAYIFAKLEKIQSSRIPAKDIEDLITQDNFKDIDPSLTLEEFKQNAFDIFKSVQESWMNFDYDTLKTLVTDEMYNMYESQLKVLKLKHQKNIMKDIELVDTQVVYANLNRNSSIEVNLTMIIRMYDYVINETSNEVVRGDDKHKLEVEYNMTFVKSDKDVKLDTCPNCGAKIEDETQDICLYCRSKLEKLSNKYVLSKKECKNQRILY